MPKSKKTETTTAEAVTTEPVTTKNADTEVVPVAKQTKSKSKTTKSTTEKTEVKTTTAPTTTTTPETIVEGTTAKNQEVENTSEVAFSDSFNEFMAKLQTISTQINSLKSEFRALEKKAVKEFKTAQKAGAKRKRKTTNRSPSGFVKPTLISNELASFLNKPTGSEMARTEVTREINNYIREHKLQDKTNGRKIIPDKQLSDLLKLQSTDELTYFNLQKYMSPHFAKVGKALEQ